MVDVKNPVNNEQLKAILNVLMKDKTKENEAKFFDELKKAHFLAPVVFDPPVPQSKEARVQIPKDTKIKFVMFTASNGDKLFPAFTDWEEVHKWKPDNEQDKTQTIILGIKDYHSMLEKANGEMLGIVVNPFGANVICKTNLLATLTGNAVPHKLEAGTKLMFAEPKVYPTQMINTIYEWCKTQESINKVYMVLMASNPGNGEAVEESYLFVVDAQGDLKPIYDGIGKLAMENANGMKIDMIDIEKAMAKKAIENRIPFYEK